MKTSKTVQNAINETWAALATAFAKRAVITAEHGSPVEAERADAKRRKRSHKCRRSGHFMALSEAELIDSDKINNASPKAVAQAAFKLIDKLQDFPSHIQITAAAALYITLSEHFKTNEQDIFTVTKNLMNSRAGKLPEFGALTDYIKNEYAH